MIDVSIRKPFLTPYPELIAAENTEGIRKNGGVLVEYVWREGGAVNEDFELTKDNLANLYSTFTDTHFMAKGLLVYFDIEDTQEQGTTTFGELLVDMYQQSMRMIIYSLRTSEMLRTSYTDSDDLRQKLNWFDSKMKTLNDDGIVQLSSVMYKKQTDGEY